MSFISQALGLSETITHQGKPYKIAPLTMEILGQWEQFLIDQAWGFLQRLRPKLSADEYRQRADGLIAAGASGQFELFGRISSEAQENPLTSTGRHLLLLRLKAGNPGVEITDAIVKEMLEESLEQILLKQRLMDAPDPNYPAPQPEAEGGV